MKRSELHLGRVPIPFGTSRSSILTGIGYQTSLHTERGGMTTVAVSDNRDAAVPGASNLRIDYSEYCPREWFTKQQVVLDAAMGAVVGKRRYAGRLFVPAVRALKDAQCDVILLHEGHYALASVPYWRQLWPDVRLVLYVNTPLSRSYTRRELRRLLAQVDSCIFVSGYTRRQVERRIGSYQVPAHVVHNGVDRGVFNATGRLPQPSGRLRVTFAGEMAPHKGPQLLLRAVAQSPDEYAVRLIGSEADGQGAGFQGKFQAELRSLAHNLGVECSIEPRLRPAELAQAFRESDVVAVPSVWPEPFGRVAIEAMACGAAVIASDRGGLPEACGGAARIVDPEDMVDFAAALREMASAEIRSMWSERGVARAAELTWRSSYESLRKALTAQ